MALFVVSGTSWHHLLYQSKRITMSLKKLVSEVAELCGHKGLTLQRVDLSSLGVALERCHPSAAEYFSNSVPSECIDRPCYQLLSPSDITTHNAEYLPSCQILPFGFVTFANEPNGDAIAVDVTDGRVYVVSHEVFTDEGIYFVGEERPIPVSRDSVLAHSENIFGSISDFFASWRNELVELHRNMDSFLRAAADNPNATDQFGNTLLIHCIRDGDLRSVKKELKRGADLNRPNGEGRTPLAEAVVFGQPTIVKHLIKVGAPVDARNYGDSTALMLAAQYAQLGCMRILLNAGADRGATDAEGRKAVDQLCAIHGNAVMKELLKPSKIR